MKLKVFSLVFFICFTVGEPAIFRKSYATKEESKNLTNPHRSYVPQEENKNRMSYFLIETADGGYEIEDLTTFTPEVKASVSDVKYYFHTQSNLNGTLVNDTMSKLPVDIFNPENEILVAIHGWNNDHTSPFNTQIKTAVLEKFDVNIIVVDWGSIAHKGYITARNAVPDIGKFVGEFLQSFILLHNVPVSKISVVGHSLGAHVSGITGSTLEGKIDHIVGLDPAGPLISVADKSYCLDASDANYVQVIHTNGAFLGLMTSLGHSDYFPNGGRAQPGCGLDLAGTCSHSRAYAYYAESIQNQFISQECTSYNDFVKGDCNGTFALMGGYNIEEGISGDFYLNTNEEYPYAIK